MRHNNHIVTIGHQNHTKHVQITHLNFQYSAEPIRMWLPSNNMEVLKLNTIFRDSHMICGEYGVVMSWQLGSYIICRHEYHHCSPVTAYKLTVISTDRRDRLLLGRVLHFLTIHMLTPPCNHHTLSSLIWLWTRIDSTPTISTFYYLPGQTANPARRFSISPPGNSAN